MPNDKRTQPKRKLTNKEAKVELEQLRAANEQHKQRESIVLGQVPIKYSIIGNPKYDIENDEVSLEHVENAIRDGYVEGELVDYTSEKDLRGWWELVRTESQIQELVCAATALLKKIDNITTADFSVGKERAERETLRNALVSFQE